MSGSTFPSALEALSFRFDEIVRLLSRRIDAALADYGLSRTQWRLLAYVLRQEGITQSELARVLELERASVGNTVDIMERKGLVMRVANPDDRRVWRIAATDRAHDLLPGLRGIIDDMLDRTFSGIPPSAIAALSGALDHIVANLADDETPQMKKLEEA
jgi:MarR family transcriptional regulator for hemolysin